MADNFRRSLKPTRHQQHLSLAFQRAATEIGPMGVKEVGGRVCLDNYRAKKGRCLCIGKCVAKAQPHGTGSVWLPVRSEFTPFSLVCRRTHASSQPSSPCARVLFAVSPHTDTHEPLLYRDPTVSPLRPLFMLPCLFTLNQTSRHIAAPVCDYT